MNVLVPTVLVASSALVILGHVGGVAVERVLADEGGSRWVDAVLRNLGAEIGRDEVSGWYVQLGFSTVPGIAAVLVWLLAIFFAPTGKSSFIYFQF